MITRDIFEKLVLIQLNIISIFKNCFSNRPTIVYGITHGLRECVMINRPGQKRPAGAGGKRLRTPRRKMHALYCILYTLYYILYKCSRNDDNNYSNYYFHLLPMSRATTLPFRDLEHQTKAISELKIGINKINGPLLLPKKSIQT